MKTPPAPGTKPTNAKTSAAKSAGPVVVEFVFERDTKNTTRFQEVVAPGASPLVGTLYVHKSTGIIGDVRVRATIETV